MCQNLGIDYSNGRSNIDHETGIHYGVIPAHAVGERWYEQSDAQYSIACPNCGYEFKDQTNNPTRCPSCRYRPRDNSEFVSDEPYSFYYDAEGYQAEQSAGSYASSDDIFILKSPYYTYCAFCSPCAPGAGYLLDFFLVPLGTPMHEYATRAEAAGYPKVFCFGHDWFENDVAPYPVYSVKTHELIEAKEG